MSNSELSENDLRDSLTMLMDSLLNSSRKDAEVSLIYQHLISNPKYLSDPKTFFYAFIYKQDKAIEAALTHVKQLTKDNESEYHEIFLNFRFYKAHIERLCTHFEGSFACADKSGVIVGRYLAFIVSGDMGKWEVEDEKCYWLPRFGTQQEWFDLMHGLFYFRFGVSEKYLTSYKALIDAGNIQYTKRGVENEK